MDDIATLSNADLDARFAEKFERFSTLRALENPTPAEAAEAISLAADLKAIRTQQASNKETAEKFAGLKDLSFDTETTTPEEPAQEEAPEEPAPVETEVETENADVTVTEPASTEASTRAKVAAAVERPSLPARTSTPTLIRASGEGLGVPMGHEFKDLTEVATAALSKMSSFPVPQGDGQSEDLKFSPIAKFAPQFDQSLVIDNQTTDDMAVLYRAADETRLPGNSLTAALGWCSPSETMYDLKADESLDGILSLPEVQVKRGGMRYTIGPQFADFYSQAGFIITETQAIAGVTKPCYTVACPPFQDVRLDAVGVCIKVPFLVESAYPELTRRFASGTLIAHEHMVNADVISRLVGLSGTERVFEGMGSTVDDGLEAFELVVAQRRQKYRLSMNRTMEAVAPHWVRGAWRADLARRQGQTTPATDAVLDQHLRAFGVNVQFVYDWQGIDESAEVYPDSYQALVYPAGTFVKGVSDVVNLSAVYDAASLATNTYTGLFVEKGLLVAKVQYDSDLVRLPICNAGRRGALDFTCAAPVV